MSNSKSNSVESIDSSAVAAREASEQAIEQARELATEAVSTIQGLDATRLSYLAALAVVVVFALVFDIASFSVGGSGPVSETQAAAERFAEARLNSWSYSAFTSCFWGKLMWLASLGGIVAVVWDTMTKSPAVWVPLAEVGSAAIACLMMLLLWFVAFPDLSGYGDTTMSATLLGYYVPLAAAGFATFISARRIMSA